MVSFAQPLLWQIRYLITGLIKKNYKASVGEFHNLISLYGYHDFDKNGGAKRAISQARREDNVGYRLEG